MNCIRLNWLRRHPGLVGAGLSCLVLAAVVLTRPAAPLAPFIVLHAPYRFPLPLRERIGRLMPGKIAASWIYWRLDQAFFGRRQPVVLQFDAIKLAQARGSGFSKLALRAPDFSDSHGLQVWQLGQKELVSLRDRLKRMPDSDPCGCGRISTGDGIECSLSQGQSITIGRTPCVAGMNVDCFTRSRAEAADLTAHVTLSEVLTNTAVSAAPVCLQTNLDVALRLQIPKGKGIFFIDASRDGVRQGPVCMVIEFP